MQEIFQKTRSTTILPCLGASHSLEPPGRSVHAGPNRGHPWDGPVQEKANEAKMMMLIQYRVVDNLNRNSEMPSGGCEWSRAELDKTGGLDP